MQLRFAQKKLLFKGGKKLRHLRQRPDEEKQREEREVNDHYS